MRYAVILGAMLALSAPALAAPQRYSILDAGLVVRNIILLDPAAAYTPPTGYTARPYQAGDVIAPLAQEVPTSVTRRQARLALNAAGLLTQAETAINAAGEATAIWYQDSDVWLRSDPHIAAMAGVLGLTDAQVDALFVQAAGF